MNVGENQRYIDRYMWGKRCVVYISHRLLKVLRGNKSEIYRSADIRIVDIGGVGTA